MKKAPVLNNRDFKIGFEVFSGLPTLLVQPVLFSWLFYVAASRLNSPRLSSLLIRSARRACQARDLHAECLVFTVTLTPPFRSTDLNEPIKYSIFKNLQAKNA